MWSKLFFNGVSEVYINLKLPPRHYQQLNFASKRIPMQNIEKLINNTTFSDFFTVSVEIGPKFPPLDPIQLFFVFITDFH